MSTSKSPIKSFAEIKETMCLLDTETFHRNSCNNLRNTETYKKNPLLEEDLTHEPNTLLHYVRWGDVQSMNDYFT